MTTFGEFAEICEKSGTLAACNVFPERNVDDKVCQLAGVAIGTLTIVDLGNVIASFLAIVGTIYLGYRSHSKYAAVGGSEMNMLALVYFFTLVSQIIALGGWRTATQQTDDPFVVWSSAINLGFIVATSWILFMNGFVGFQLLEDGQWASMLSIAGSTFALFIVTVYISVDTAYSVTGAFASDPSTLSNLALFILTLILPLVCVVAYIILVTILVMRTLSQRKPLAYVLAGAILFGVGQIFTFLISDSICTGVSRVIDGNLFNTLLTFTAMWCVFQFWSSITEDNWDNFEDQF